MYVSYQTTFGGVRYIPLVQKQLFSVVLDEFGYKICLSENLGVTTTVFQKMCKKYQNSSAKILKKKPENKLFKPSELPDTYCSG